MVLEASMIKAHIAEHKHLSSCAENSIKSEAAIKHPDLHPQIMPKILSTINLQSEIKNFENSGKQNQVSNELEAQNQH